MANEKNLRERWYAVFEDSPAYRAATLAAEESRLARKASFAAKRRAAATAFERAELDAEERALEGTGQGEIKLAALRSTHAREVNGYLDRTRKENAERYFAGGDVATKVSPDVNYANHFPWITPNFDMSPSKSEMVRTAEQRVRASGRDWTPADKLYAASASGDQRSFDEAAHTLTEQKNALQAEERVSDLDSRREYAATERAAKAERKRVMDARIAGGLERAFGEIDARSSTMRPVPRFDMSDSMGGRLTLSDGRQLVVPPGGSVAQPIRRAPTFEPAPASEATASAAVQPDRSVGGASGSWEESPPPAAPTPQRGYDSMETVRDLLALPRRIGRAARRFFGPEHMPKAAWNSIPRDNAAQAVPGRSLPTAGTGDSAFASAFAEIDRRRQASRPARRDSRFGYEE